MITDFGAQPFVQRRCGAGRSGRNAKSSGTKADRGNGFQGRRVPWLQAVVIPRCCVPGSELHAASAPGMKARDFPSSFGTRLQERGHPREPDSCKAVVGDGKFLVWHAAVG